MSLKISEDMLVALYEYFAASKPFSDWNMPPAEDVIFKVARTPHLYGWSQIAVEGRGRNRKVQHYITISGGRQAHTYTLMLTMAHEMIHVHQERVCVGSKTEHGPAFKKLAREVAKHHGFDPLAL